MEYFFMTESCGPEVGSNYPQSISPGKGYDLACKNGVYELMKQVNDLPDFEPVFGDVVLAPYANLTDIISAAYLNGLLGKLLNKKALDVFLSYRIPKHKIYSVNVIYMGQNYAYYWLHIVSNEFELIDFEKSKYMKTSPIGKKSGDISIKSHSDYLEQQNKGYQGYSIKFEQLYLYKDAIKYDLFSTNGGLSDVFVSSKLKEGLERNGITGLSFRELPKWINFE